jgi:tetratricopeptide (TPR) repeat protein
VWYAGDRARLHSEARSRGREANAALDQAEVHLRDLRTKLDDPFKVRELLSDIDHWQAMAQQARQSWQHAVSASVGEEVRVAEETRARIQAVEAAVQGEEAAYQLAKNLDNIAVDAFTSLDLAMPKQRAAVADYERLFAQEGLDVRQPGTDWFVSAIRSSPVRFALIAALDNWAVIVGWMRLTERRESLARRGVPDNKTVLAGFIEDPLLARLLELTRAADPDPWRDRFRDPAVWSDRVALIQLAKEVDVGQQSPTVLASLGWLMNANQADPTTLFERALIHYPQNFWLHLQAHRFGKDRGAKIGLALAALAVRPRNAVLYASLAWFLGERGDWPEALAAANRTIEIKPDYVGGHVMRGLARREQNDLPGAIVALQRAIELAPGTAWPRYSLGQVLQQQGRYTEAEQAYLGAIQAQPSSYGSYLYLAQLLTTCPDDKVRDGKRAVEYATTACERSGWNDPTCLDTLAAAYAEAGQFEQAIRYQTRVVEDPALKGDLRTAAAQRLELYRKKKLFRDQGP